jgi:hypothetical protein
VQMRVVLIILIHLVPALSRANRGEGGIRLIPSPSHAKDEAQVEG